MTQLFHNLISNALRFSSEKPVIKVSSKRIVPADYRNYPELKKDTAYVSISVQDNGIGFDQKYASKVFLLFQKLGYDKSIEGTGIGLAICKKIVDEHEGLIYATSKKNVGTTFTVILPSG
jgi:signal transduction histidine kinase